MSDVELRRTLDFQVELEVEGRPTAVTYIPFEAQKYTFPFDAFIYMLYTVPQ